MNSWTHKKNNLMTLLENRCSMYDTYSVKFWLGTVFVSFLGTRFQVPRCQLTMYSGSVLSALILGRRARVTAFSTMLLRLMKDIKRLRCASRVHYSPTHRTCYSASKPSILILIHSRKMSQMVFYPPRLPAPHACSENVTNLTAASYNSSNDVASGGTLC